MAISKENYQVTTTDPQGMMLRINSILSSISDRLDKIEGIRGGSSIESALDMNDNDINNIGSMDIDSATIASAVIETLSVGALSFTSFGWDDITSDLAAGKAVGVNAPTWTTFRDGIEAYSFDDSAMNEIWITFHIKHDYSEATNVYPHVHWSPDTTSTGVVRWGFEYTHQKGHDQGAFGATTTIYVNHEITSNKQYQHIISEISDADSFDAFEADTLVLVRVFRDAADSADTFPDPVFAFTSDIHFQVEQQSTPNKVPPFL